jgi:1-deoxy-D-xylulose-5-phosphate synthase
MAPADYDELRQMLYFAINKQTGPIAIRYPRGRGKEYITEKIPLKPGKGAVLKRGENVCILAVGSMVDTAIQAAEKLESQGVSTEVISARFIKPIDEELIVECGKKFEYIVTLEDNCKFGGFGSRVMEVLSNHRLKTNLSIMGLPEDFIPHGSRNELLKNLGLDFESVANNILKIFRDN